jgi:hypothetical protein
MLGMETNSPPCIAWSYRLYEKQNSWNRCSFVTGGQKFSAIQKDGEALLKKMKPGDEDMVQRKSKAYRHVENFPNKFTWNYLIHDQHRRERHSAR